MSLEDKLETAQSTITSQAIQLENVKALLKEFYTDCKDDIRNQSLIERIEKILK